MSAVTYYCGDSRIVKVSIDNGATWTNRFVPSIGPSPNLMDIMAWPGQSDKVTVVGTRGAIWTSLDQGVTWNNASPVSGNVNYYFEEIWHVDSNTSYAVGGNGSGMPVPVFAKSTDGGVSYVISPTLVDTGLNVIFSLAQIISVHFASPNIGVIGVQGIINNILGYPPSSGVDQVWVLGTGDGGATWQVLNGQAAISPGTLPQGTKPWGIKMQYDGVSDYIINLIVDAGTSSFRSANSGTSFSNIGKGDPQRHITWESTNIWVTTVGGNNINLSTDTGISYTPIQSGLLEVASAAHFYQDSGLIGYYSSGEQLYRTIDSGATGTLVDSISSALTIWAVWSELVSICPFIVQPCICPPRCYTLQDCSGILDNIQVVETDRPTPIGGALTYDEYPGTCWEVIAYGFCQAPLDIQPTGGAADCECCLPKPEPEPEPLVRYPYILTKIYNRITVGECDIEANKKFGEAIYDLVKKLKFGIETNCPINLDQAWIDKELSDLQSIYNPDLCIIPIETTCCPEPEPCVYPIPIVCAPASEVATSAEWNCPSVDIETIEADFN